jgi:hypothetical protein
MLVSELLAAAQFLREFVEKREVAQRLQELVEAVGKAAQNQAPGAVEAALAKLEQLHADADLAEQSPATRRLIKQFGGFQVLGTGAMLRIRAIFNEHRANPPAITAALQGVMSETTALAKRAKQLIATLGPMMEEVPDSALAADEGRLWLFFEHQVAVDSMENLRDAADEWREILHHFSRVKPGTPANARILSIQKSSPMVLELAANVALLVPILWAVDRVVATLGRVIELRKKHEELKQLKAKTAILSAIAEQVKDERAELAASTANEIQKRFGCENEARNAVQVALEKIARFIEGGGEMDIDVKDDALVEPGAATEGPRTELRTLIAHVRKEFFALPPFEGEPDGKVEEPK